MQQHYRRNDGQIDPLKSRLADAIAERDNKLCQECMCRGPHTWASWNLGVFLCIRCAGIHRKLGVHISKVKSCTLDQWQREHVNSLATKGNSQAWLYYEHNLPEGYVRPNDTSHLEMFIRNKYERKLYTPKDGSVPLPGEQAGSPPRDVASKPPSEKKEPRDTAKKLSYDIEKTSESTNSLRIPDTISRPRSQPSSPAKPEGNKPEEGSLLLDVGSGMTASRSESDFAFIDNFEKLFGVERTSQKSNHLSPKHNIPTQNQNGSGIDFLEPLVQSTVSPQMNTHQIMSLYNVRPQAPTGRMGGPFPPKLGPQPQRYPPNASLYREQQQKLKEVADIQKTINSIKVPGAPLPSSQPANGTDYNDPWEQPAVNMTPTQSGKTLSQDLWL